MKSSKERVLDAVGHKPIDRVPVDFRATPETQSKLQQHYGLSDRTALLEKLNVDICYIDGPDYVGPPLREYSDGSKDDIWGVRRKVCRTGEGDKVQSYQMLVSSPLKDIQSVDEVLSYEHWPNPDHFDYRGIRRQCRQAGDRAVFFMGDRLNRIAQFKPAQYLRGMEEIMIDAVLYPEIFAAILQRIKTFYTAYLTRILAAAEGMIDVVVTGDDFGTQNGLMISKPLWREHIYPGFKEFIDICHSFHVPVMHHTCGSIRDLIPDMIEAGLDVLNPLQPEVRDMDHGQIKAQFGDRLCFHGGIGIQKNLPFGTPEDVRREVQKAFLRLAPTGYIACTAHNIQGDTPLENILALFAAYEQYR